MVSTSLMGCETESAKRERVAGSGTTEMNDSGEAVLLFGRGLWPRGEFLCHTAVEQGSRHLDSMTRNDTGIEAVEPTGMLIMPGAIFNHMMVVYTESFRGLKRSIGQLKHSHGAGGRLIPGQGVPTPVPAPVGSGHRVAIAFDLSKCSE